MELVAADGWVEELRQVKEPAELERVGAACAVADAALTRLLPTIRPGVTERELALALEWEMRTHGAEALAFDVACLGGPRAALPHGSPTDRAVQVGRGPAVRLRGAGLRLPLGHDPDAVRGRADAARPGHLRAGRGGPGGCLRRARRCRRGTGRAAHQPGHRRGGTRPSSRRPAMASTSAMAWVMASASRPTRRRRSVGWRRNDRCHRPRCSASSRASTWTARWVSASRTSCSFDAAQRRCELLTHFPREVTVVGV